MTAGRQLIMLWGVGGVCASLVSAVVRLSPMMVEGAQHAEAGLVHGVVAVFWIAFMAYSEGYRGFQQRFSPMVVARAEHLAANPVPLHVVLAPAFCMGLFHATPRRLKLSWGVLIAVTGLVLVVRQLPQPWRGVVDAGVVVGLSWGLVATLYSLAAAYGGRSPGVSAEVPTPAPVGASPADG